MDKPEDPVRPIPDEQALQELLDGPTVILYKHSTRCGVSFRARNEVRRFARAHPHVRVGLVDVLANRPLSDLIASRFEIPHQSPQAIVLRDGKVVWSASHRAVSAAELGRHVSPSSP